MSMKGIFAIERKLPSEQRSIKFSYHSLQRARFRDKFPFLNVIQTGSKNGRSPNVPPYDQRCTEWNEEQEEFAWNLHKELLKTKRHHKDVHKNKLLQKYTATGLAVQSKERVCTVNSDASLQMM